MTGSAQKKAAEDRLKRAEENLQAATDDQAGQKEQFRIMREDVFHGDKSTSDAADRLRAKGVAPDKILEFQQKAGRACTPDQIALIEKGYNP